MSEKDRKDAKPYKSEGNTDECNTDLCFRDHGNSFIQAQIIGMKTGNDWLLNFFDDIKRGCRKEKGCLQASF